MAHPMTVEIPNSNNRLEDKVAIVSGAGTHGGEGIGNGAAAAILFASEGAKVTIVDQEASWGETTKKIIEDIGGEAIVVEADVSNSEDCYRTVEKTVSEFNELHILHNNVGVGTMGSVIDADNDTWDQSFCINLKSMVDLSRYSIPYMQEAGNGSIINISSVSALRPKMGDSSAPYTTTKSAVIGLTRAMAIDHADHDIRVNCILPGLIWTPRIANHSPNDREMRQNSTPLSKEGQPWDIGWAAVFLASDEAEFITGVNLPVDGGFLLAGPPN